MRALEAFRRFVEGVALAGCDCGEAGGTREPDHPTCFSCDARRLLLRFPARSSRKKS